MNAPAARLGECCECGKAQQLLMPLHGEKGGPMTCIPCGVEWHAKHSRRRKFRRIVIKAIKAYFEAGGTWEDVDRLQCAAAGVALFDFEADTSGGDLGDITLELLEAAVRLTHPDRHPPERQEAAHQVTQELLALKPFVFPAPKEKPKERDASVKTPCEKTSDPLRLDFPCELCIGQLSSDYCNDCKAEHDKREEKDRERERKKRRMYAKRAKQRREWKRAMRPEVKCSVCAAEFKGKRKDARYCSAACRQRAHRQRVTGNKPAPVVPGSSRYAEAAA